MGRESVEGRKKQVSSFAGAWMLSRKFIIGGLIIFIALAFLGYRAFKESVPYYYTVSELSTQGDSVCNQLVRVNGVVAPGTVEPGADTLTIEFKLTDGSQSLPVIYHGVVSPTFKEGAEVVIEGRYNPDAVFEASSILTRCPAKYVPEKLDIREK